MKTNTKIKANTKTNTTAKAKTKVTPKVDWSTFEGPYTYNYDYNTYWLKAKRNDSPAVSNMEVALLKTYTGKFGSFMREGVAPTLAKVLHKDIELGVWAATMSQSDFMKEVKGIKFKCGAALIEIL